MDGIKLKYVLGGWVVADSRLLGVVADFISDLWAIVSIVLDILIHLQGHNALDAYLKRKYCGS